MSLHKQRLARGETLNLPDGHSGVFVLKGMVELRDQTLAAGGGGYVQDGFVVTTDGAELLRFSVTTTETANAMLAQRIDWTGADCAFRLDQVSFPPGAQAYRHTHPGPGIRCLTTGALEIRSDHHAEMMSPMSAWFEDTDSPVQATAGGAPTAFVRAMLLPLEFLGKPTLNILDPDDLTKPRLQSNQRFFDQVLRLRAD